MAKTPHFRLRHNPARQMAFRQLILVVNYSPIVEPRFCPAENFSAVLFVLMVVRLVFCLAGSPHYQCILET